MKSEMNTQRGFKMTSKNAKTVIILVLINVLHMTISEDIPRTHKHAMPIADDHLLRSGDERKIKESIQKPRDIINVELNPNSTHAIERTTQNFIDKSSEFSTVVPQTDRPEALGLTGQGDTTEIVADIKDENIETTTILPETTTEVEPDVYKQTPTEANDATSVEATKSTTKMERASTTTTTPTTSTTTDDASGPRISRLDDEQNFGQRNAKTDNSEAEAEPQIETRSFEALKPRSDPQVTKSTQLRGWIEDTWLRSPPGILVPLRPSALSRALAVWNDLTSEGRLNVSDVVVIGYDSNGVNWRSRHNLQGNNAGSDKRAVTEVLSKLLRKYQDVNTIAGDGTMRALTTSAKLVPYDSALFVLTDRGAADAQRLPLALRPLVEKRLKVYTIWTDPNYPSTNSKTALQELRNVSSHTEGEVLPYALEVMDMELSNEHSNMPMDVLEITQSRMAKLNSLSDEKLETLIVKRGGGGAISLGVPVETGVTALRVLIEGAVDHAVLYPPNDAPQIDLFNQTSVDQFSRGSKTNNLSPRDVFIVFPGAEGDDTLSVLPMTVATTSSSTTGTWHLSLRCATCDYRLTVRARALLGFRAQSISKDLIRLRVVGPVASVRESTLVDEYGTELGKLAFSYQPAAGEGDDPRIGDQDQELVAEVAMPTVKASRVYAKIVGRDLLGESFVRLSGPLSHVSEVRTGRSAYITYPDSINDLELAEEYNQRLRDTRMLYNDSNVLPSNRAASQVVNQLGTLMTTVQIGLSSRVYGAPGDNLQLHFEVTNYRDQNVNFRFEAVGELRFLRGISPVSQTIASGQTAIVIVSLRITAGTQPGARDLITFTAYGLDQVSMSAYVYVVNADTAITDVWAPSVSHTFQGTCIGKLGTDCAQHVWSVSILARDNVGGLLRLSSTPAGLLHASNFIAGTREEVIATYRATCCAPRVMISAVDAFGNANSYVVDISNYFTPASVAAIVLGVFMLIILIAVIVLLICWCVRRRRDGKELSYTASSSRREIS